MDKMKMSALDSMLELMKLKSKLEDLVNETSSSCNCKNCKSSDQDENDEEDDDEDFDIKQAIEKGDLPHKKTLLKFHDAMVWAFGENYTKKQKKELKKAWKEKHPDLPEIEFPPSTLDISIMMPFQIAEHYFTRQNKEKK